MKRKALTIGLTVCVLAVAVIVFIQLPSQPESEILPEILPHELNEDIDVAQIEAGSNKRLEIALPAPSPEPISTPEIDNGAENDIQLTVIEQNPSPNPPELPQAAVRPEQTGDATPEDVIAHEELDPELKNPNVKPTATPAPVTSTPMPTTPPPNDGNNSGGNNSGGLPGFDSVPDGGANQGGTSGSDGDWDKEIGSMG